MSLILFIKHGRVRQLDLGRPMILAGTATLGLLTAAILFLAGYGLASWFTQPPTHGEAWETQFSSQAREVAHAKQTAQANIDALSAKVGEVQAHIIRLDALGQQLTRMAGLQHGEFNFDEPPAEGGPEVSGPLQDVALPDFISNLDQLSAQINNREQQLTVLESLLMNRNVQLEALPSGPPVLEGYVSSPFGMRIDPFTGELSFHPGIDFAGPEGEAVEAVAAGVVTWAGPRTGYGNMVEIDHGNGYATLYGHNEQVLVHMGEVVKKGQKIALMGSTGRSTGPHVHFEVLYNGKPVNPARFVRPRGGCGWPRCHGVWIDKALKSSFSARCRAAPPIRGRSPRQSDPPDSLLKPDRSADMAHGFAGVDSGYCYNCNIRNDAMVNSLLKKVFGSRNERLLRGMHRNVARINALGAADADSFG